MKRGQKGSIILFNLDLYPLSLALLNKREKQFGSWNIYQFYPISVGYYPIDNTT